MAARTTRTRQRGATILEFGLAFMVFFFVLYGIMEFGRIVSSYNILSGAVREGARYAAVRGSASGSPATSSDIQDQVRRWAVGLTSSNLAVTTTWSPGNGPGSAVRVSASYTVAPFTSLIIGSPLTVQSTSQMVISQ